VSSFYPALDGLRGIAILLVLLHHFTILSPATAFDARAVQLPILGWSGVDLFFVLSGFLITGILIDARGSDRYFASFYARRTLRIFPLYYLVTFLSLIVLPQARFWYDLLAGPGAPPEQWPYWLYLTNFAVAARERFLHGVLDIAWSLAIEEQFYLLWPAVVWLCPPRALGALCLAIVVGAPVARVAALASGVAPIPVYVLPFFRADALATGALLAWAARRYAVASLTGAATAAGIAGAMAIAIVCWRDGESWWWGPVMQRAGYSSLALTGAAMLLNAIARPADHWWPRALSAGWLRAFGKYSYCLYLIHLPVMRTVREFVWAPEQFASLGSVWLGQIVFYVLATAPAFALAWLSWRVFEAPILRLKERFPYGTRNEERRTKNATENVERRT
jgi:peptidoglycan/LPS O-acetylase OafA/YrhL